MLSKEDFKDVKRDMGTSKAKKVLSATDDSKKKSMAKKMGNPYLKHLKPEVSGRGRLVPAPNYKEEVDRVKSFKPKGSMSWKALRNKSKTEEGDDVRAARFHLDRIGKKNKEAYAEQGTHRKGEWMIHYK